MRSITVSCSVDTVWPVSDDDAADVPDQLLRSALEFAVSTAAAGAKQRPPLPIPTELRRFLRTPKLQSSALPTVRAAVDGDADFRKRVAEQATEELVDQIGLLWLTRPDGWVEAINELLPQTPSDDGRAAIRREERRRHAAQEAAARARAESLSLSAEIARERAAKADLILEMERLRAELDEVRLRLRESQRAEHATAQALAKAEAGLLRARSSAATAEAAAAEAEQAAVDAGKVRDLIEAAVASSREIAARLAQALDELPDEPASAPTNVGSTMPRLARRKPLPLPGGALKGSPETAEAWLRTSGVKVLVDGYNVAKLGWPALDLDNQRQQCIRAAENLAKRWNLSLTIVFDGASIEGAHASTRRRVRIVYSPQGVSADDVLRASVTGTDPEQPVVVVTNDRAIISDVAEAGANTVSSDAFLGLTH